MSAVRRAVGVALWGVTAALPIIAAAQTAPAKGDVTLPTIKVDSPDEETEKFVAKSNSTGSKTDTPIIETPQSISVLTSDFIEAVGATNVREALAYTPGVVAQFGADSRFDTLITIRGLDGFTGYFADGLTFRNDGGFGVWRTNNYGTERIEILRGPASVLYGQNGAGGLVNIISKRPQLEASRDAFVRGGNDQLREIGTDFTGAIDGEGKLLYRFVGNARDAELQFGDMPNDDVYLAPSLTWQPSDNTSITFLSSYSDFDGGITRRILPVEGTLVRTPAGTRLPAGKFTGDADFDRQGQRQRSIGYEASHRFNDTFTVRQNLRYARLEGDIRMTFQFPSYATVNEDDPNDPANFRLLERSIFTTDSKVKYFTVDNQLQTQLQTGDLKHTLLFGLDFQRSSFDLLAFFGGDGGTIDAFDPSIRTPMVLPVSPDDLFEDSFKVLRQTGVYLQDQIKIGERWTATLGGRYDFSRFNTEDRFSETKFRIADDKFTGRAGLVYLAPGGFAPYVSYAESFVPTGLIDANTGTPFKPETGRQYEAGLRYQPANGWLSGSLAAFDLRRQNVISEDGDGIERRQIGERTIRGLELETQITPLPNLIVLGTYTFTPKADVTKSVVPSEVGKQEGVVSRNQFTLFSQYRFGFGLEVGAGVRYIGPNDGELEAAPARVPAYTLVDGVVGYTLNNWELRINARNVANKTYKTLCGATSCRLGDQRQLSGTVNYRW